MYSHNDRIRMQLHNLLYHDGVPPDLSLGYEKDLIAIHPHILGDNSPKPASIIIQDSIKKKNEELPP
jgi:hypothetical protein